jgi:hypothetical protein
MRPLAAAIRLPKWASYIPPRGALPTRRWASPVPRSTARASPRESGSPAIAAPPVSPAVKAGAFETGINRSPDDPPQGPTGGTGGRGDGGTGSQASHPSRGSIRHAGHLQMIAFEGSHSAPPAGSPSRECTAATNRTDQLAAARLDRSQVARHGRQPHGHDMNSRGERLACGPPEWRTAPRACWRVRGKLFPQNHLEEIPNDVPPEPRP